MDQQIDVSGASEVVELNFPKTPTMGTGQISVVAHNEANSRAMVSSGDYAMSYNIQILAKPGSKSTAQKFITDKLFTLLKTVKLGDKFRALGKTTVPGIQAFLSKELNNVDVHFVYIPPAPGTQYGTLTIYPTEAEAQTAFERAKVGVGSATPDFDLDS